ncbi:MAG TPA: cyclopropane-fatty-acyl-phospholipid synthase family protein [Actinomycetes bacterium]|nr:cyclopropane-fatty-acyl-phospholipid synthase family protein [Actinomycetes bacterium]
MTTTAAQLTRLLALAMGREPALRVRAWDGSEVGPDDAPVVEVRSRDAVRYLAHAPNELGLARAYVSGSIGVQGDIYEVLGALPLENVDQMRRKAFIPRQRAELAALALKTGALGRAPDPPPEEAALSGRRHTKDRDRRAVTHHYDVGNDFYRLVLGPSMVYSCAYWRCPDDPSYTLEDAQRDKLDLVCRKLGLHQRTGPVRMLDVGCGWGSLLLHAASTYGVTGVGVTLSQPQAELARARLAEAGLSDQVEIRVQDYRDVDDGPYDVVASIGMAEHVGEEAYGGYARQLFDLMAPTGRLLNHQISRRPGPRREGTSFIEAYVFPDGELLPVATTVGILEESGFEVRDVESLREHYALTLRRWVANLEQGWDRAVELSSEGRARVWRLYMAASALSFEAGRLGVNQVLAVRQGPGGASGFPATRERLLGTATA